MQLPLLFDPPALPDRGGNAVSRHQTDRQHGSVEALDQCMPTREVLRIVGVNRTTVFRWIRKGLFPQKHVAGGWLRSDIERWLSAKNKTLA